MKWDRRSSVRAPGPSLGSPPRGGRAAVTPLPLVAFRRSRSLIRHVRTQSHLIDLLLMLGGLTA